MNGDSAPDLLATSIDGNGVRLWLNDGSGRWEADPRYLPKFGVFYGLEVRDIDRDGKLVCGAEATIAGLGASKGSIDRRTSRRLRLG